MSKIFTDPFAFAGDADSIPDTDQPSGKVSYPAGWTPDYSLPQGDPNRKLVGRKEVNGAFKMVTQAVGEMQLFGFAIWQPLTGGWPMHARVAKDGKLYRSTADNNATTPPSATWVEWGVDRNDVMPVGATYMQFPGRAEPAALFGGAWSQLYAGDGVFFRTEGSGAAAFGGGVQADEIKAHKHNATIADAGQHAHSGTTGSAGEHTHTRGTMNIKGEFGVETQEGDRLSIMAASGAFVRKVASDLFTKANNSSTVIRGATAEFDASRAWTGSTSNSGTHSHPFTTSDTGQHWHDATISNTGGSETRPRNITVRIWVRTA